MRIDSNRNPLNTPAPFIGDPPPTRTPEHLLPLPHWYGPAPSRMDQSEPYDSPPVQPSIRQYDNLEDNAWQKATRALEPTSYLAEQNALLWALLHLELKRRHKAQGKPLPTEVSYTAFEIDNALEHCKGWTLGERDERGTRKLRFDS